MRFPNSLTLLRAGHCAVVCALALSAPRSSQAVVDVVNDRWSDGTDSDPAAPIYSENGVNFDSDVDLESPWFQGGVGSLDPAGLGGPLVGSTHNPADGANPSTNSASWTTYFMPAGDAITLANAGNFMRVTWKFSLVGVNSANTSQGFRFGVVDSGARLAGPGTLPVTTNAGYAIWGNMGSTLGNSNSFQLRERTLMTDGNLFNTTSDFGAILGNGAGSGQNGYWDGINYTMTWLMTRGASDNLLLDVSIAGGTLGDGMSADDGVIRTTVDDPTPNTFQFDTFSIRLLSETITATEFRTSLFRVEVIPEPSALACGLTAVAALIGAARRRR